MKKGDCLTRRLKVCYSHTDNAPVRSDSKKPEQGRDPYSHKEHLKLTHNVLYSYDFLE